MEFTLALMECPCFNLCLQNISNSLWAMQSIHWNEIQYSWSDIRALTASSCDSFRYYKDQWIYYETP